jgi:hypothetical protein
MDEFGTKPSCTKMFKWAISAVALLVLATVAHAQEQASDKVGETRLSLAEARTVWLVPALTFSRQSLTYGESNSGNELASGVDIAIRLISSSNRDRTLLVGLDLRQNFSQVANRDRFDLAETKLGVRLEGQPRWLFQPSFALGWYFGDTVVVRHRDIQFNGNTLSGSLSLKTGKNLRTFIEASAGTYNEGPGFIMLSRRPGIETLNIKTFEVGIEIPIEFVSPSWIEWSDGPKH